MDLAGDSEGVLGDEFHVFRDLVVGDAALAVFVNALASDRVVGQVLHLYHHRHLLSVLLVGNCDHLGIQQSAHLHQVLLDLFRVDVLAPADNHVLYAAHDRQVALLVQHPQIARFHPALLDALACCLLVAPVVQHH